MPEPDFRDSFTHLAPIRYFGYSVAYGARSGKLRAMIDSDEIKAKAEELGVNIANVERDYVFGWMLAGLFHTDNKLGYRLILKGGNGFRKAYFRDARFSKDLDFSMTEAFDADVFNQGVKQACEYVADMTGIEFDFDRQNVKLKRGCFHIATVHFRSGRSSACLQNRDDALPAHIHQTSS